MENLMQLFIENEVGISGNNFQVNLHLKITFTNNLEKRKCIKKGIENQFPHTKEIILTVKRKYFNPLLRII